MDSGEQQKRLLLTVVTVMAVMLLWTYFFGPKPLPPDAVGPQAADGADGGAVAQAPAPTPAPEAPPAEVEPPAEPEIPDQEVVVETPAQRLVFSNRGAGLRSARIKDAGRWPGRKFESRGGPKGSDPKPVDMVQLLPGMPAVGASAVSGGLNMPFDAAYQVERDGLEVTFRGSNRDVSVEKVYRVNENGYDLRVAYRVRNLTDRPAEARLSITVPAAIDPAAQKPGSFFGSPPELSEMYCRHDGDNTRIGARDEPRKESLPGPVQILGLDERYFMGVVFPRFAQGTRCELSTRPDGKMSSVLEVDLGTLAPGETATRELGMYLGPKAIGVLQDVSQASAAGVGPVPLGQAIPAGSGQPGLDPELEDAVDFGWWAVIARVLLAIMKAFQSVVVNWGLAIILLTVLVKVLLYPLSHKQMESMEAMRALQPQMEALQKKYANDKEKLNLERMRLFQENKVNPFGGCLPLLIQMPVWIALYRTLLGSFELYREPLLPFWIRDLTLADPYYILPLAMGATMFITQKLQPQMGDPKQARLMLYFMPIFFTFIMLNLPAGLTLYIFTNNILSIGQQKYLTAKFAKRRALAAAK